MFVLQRLQNFKNDATCRADSEYHNRRHRSLMGVLRMQQVLVSLENGLNWRATTLWRMTMGNIPPGDGASDSAS